MINLNTSTALVTGASSGIGRDMAQILAERGIARLILTARSQSELESVAAEIGKIHATECHIIVADLADPGGLSHLKTSVDALDVAVDILINNAGFGQRGPFVDISHDRQMNMISLNITALTSLSHHFLPSMVARGSGGILNVASMAAFMAGPNMAVYYATKAYVLSLSEALAEEVADAGVHVTALCPGATETGFSDAADLEGSKLFRAGVMSSREVAEIGVDGLLEGEVISVAGFKNRLLAASVKAAPRSVTRKIARSLQS